MELLLGAHTSTAGGVSKAITLADKLGFKAIQIFTKNNNRWEAKPLDPNEVEKFKSLWKESNIEFIVVHDSYLISLCAKDEVEYEKVISDFDSIIGLDKLQCFHINDSKKELGSRVDRHEHIGQGYIGLEGFSNIMNDSRLTHIPKILETPKGKEQLEDLENLDVLRSLINSN